MPMPLLLSMLDSFARSLYLLNIRIFLVFLKTFYMPLRRYSVQKSASLLHLFSAEWLLENLQRALSLRSLCDVHGGTLINREVEEKVIIKALRLVDFTGLPQNEIKKSITRKMIRECWVWSLLHHENICPFRGLSKLDNFDLPVLVSLYIPHGCLEYLKDHPERRLVAVRETTAGLKYLHDTRIVHGDIKPDNIMINDEGRVQIIDFGLSKFESMTGFTTEQQGQRNPRYCAPELLRQAMAEGVIRPTFEADIFSLAMTMLQIMDGRGTGSIPYNHFLLSWEFELWQQLTTDQGETIERPQLDRYKNVPSAFHNLLQRCWEELPIERPSITTVDREFRQLEGFLGELPPLALE